MADDLLHGLWREETFAVLGARWARDADRELTRLRSAASWAEAVEVAESMTAVRAPFDASHDLEEDFGIDPLSTFDAGDVPGVQDGDFPPMPGRLSYRWLPEDLWGGTERLAVESIETTFNGSYLFIAPDQEQALVEALAARGHRTTRDDALVNRIAWWS